MEATLPGTAVETTVEGLVSKKVYYFRLKVVKGDRSCVQSGVDGDISMYRINSPA